MNEPIKQGLWILRATPYRESGQLLDLFTEKQGKVTAIVHGSRKPKSPLKAIFQPFNFISAILSYKNSDLCFIKEPELQCSLMLSPKEMICAQYLNELLFYLLERNVPEPQIFLDYFKTLKNLSCEDQPNLEVLLRSFELDLLDHLGYGINFFHDYRGDQIQNNLAYSYDLENGFIPLTYDQSFGQMAFSGQDLASMCKRDFRDKRVLSATKKICKMVINSKLGNHKIMTRALFAQYLSTRR